MAVGPIWSRSFFRNKFEVVKSIIIFLKVPAASWNEINSAPS